MATIDGVLREIRETASRSDRALRALPAQESGAGARIHGGRESVLKHGWSDFWARGIDGRSYDIVTPNSSEISYGSRSGLADRILLSRPLHFVIANEDVGGDLQSRREPPNHVKRKRVDAIKHFRDTPARADERLQILARQFARFHHVQQEIDRIEVCLL